MYTSQVLIHLELSEKLEKKKYAISLIIRYCEDFFLKGVIKERHSLNWERRRSATPFFQKERCGSGPPFLRAGAGAERRSKNMGALNTLHDIYST